MHKGVYWESDSFILKDNCLVEKASFNRIIRVKDISLEAHNESQKLSFTLKNYNKNTKAHVFASTFLPCNPSSPFFALKSLVSNKFSIEPFQLSKPQNMYISNKKLSTEFRYVFERKFLNRFMGNTLDRPQLLLQRHRLKETSYQSFESYEEKLINLTIKTLSQKTFCLDIGSQETIYNLKKKIQSIEGTHPDLNRLIFEGKQLEDGRRLCDYNINSGSLLHMVMKLRGGPVSTDDNMNENFSKLDGMAYAENTPLDMQYHKGM